MIKAHKQVVLKNTPRLQEGESHWAISIDDGYCARQFSIEKNPITGQYSVQTLANAVEKVCRTIPCERPTSKGMYNSCLKTRKG